MKKILAYIIVAFTLNLALGEFVQAKNFKSRVSKDFYIDTESILSDFNYENDIVFDDDFIYLKNYKPIYLLSMKDLIYVDKTPIAKSYQSTVPMVYNLSFNQNISSANPSLGYTIQAEPKTKTLAQMLEMATEYAGSKDYPKAITTYEEICQNYPKKFEIYYKYGESLLENKNYYKAIYAFNEAIRLNPDYVLGYYSLGNVYFELKDYQNALKNYLSATKINPYNLDAHYKLAAALEKMNRKDLAMQYYKKCLKIDANSSKTKNAIARLSSL